MGDECHLPSVAKEVLKRGQVGTHNSHGHSYWIGQKVLLGFSTTSYGKTQMNILANSILLISSCVKVWPVISKQLSCMCVCVWVCVCGQMMVFRGPFTSHRHSKWKLAVSEGHASLASINLLFRLWILGWFKIAISLQLLLTQLLVDECFLWFLVAAEIIFTRRCSEILLLEYSLILEQRLSPQYGPCTNLWDKKSTGKKLLRATKSRGESGHVWVAFGAM